MAIRQLTYPNTSAPVQFADYQRQNALIAGLVQSGGSIQKIAGWRLLRGGYYNYKGILYYGETDTTILTKSELGTKKEGFVVLLPLAPNQLIPYFMDIEKQNDIYYEPQWGGYYYTHGTDNYLVLRTSVDLKGDNFDNLSMLDTGARVGSSLWVDGDFYSKGKLIDFDKLSSGGGGDGIDLTKPITFSGGIGVYGGLQSFGDSLFHKRIMSFESIYAKGGFVNGNQTDKYALAMVECSQAFYTIRYIMENAYATDGEATSGIQGRYLCTGFVVGIKGASDNPTTTFIGTASALTYPDVAKDEADGKIPTIWIELGEKGLVSITPQGVRWDVGDMATGDMLDLDTEVIGLFINW